MKKNLQPEEHCGGLAYRCHVECEEDIDALLTLIPEGELLRFASLGIHGRYLVAQIEVRSISIGTMRDLTHQVMDGHVMTQTIQPKARFTGERDWSL